MRRRGGGAPLLAKVSGFELIQFPSKRWGFVGRVPSALSYRYKDGSPISAKDAHDIAQHGAGLFRNRVDTVVFDSPEEAIAAARALGFEPANARSFSHGRYRG